MSKYVKEVNKYLSRLKKGDQSQINGLFNLTANHLRVVAQLYLNNKTYCDDVVSEVYKRALKYVDSFDEMKDGYNWLCKITERVAYDFNVDGSVFDNAVPIEATKITFDSFEEIDAGIDLSAALNQLDKESKAMILMYYYLGYTLEEIGQHYGKNKSFAHKKIKRILKRLKELLQER